MISILSSSEAQLEIHSHQGCTSSQVCTQSPHHPSLNPLYENSNVSCIVCHLSQDSHLWHEHLAIIYGLERSELFALPGLGIGQEVRSKFSSYMVSRRSVFQTIPLSLILTSLKES